MLRNVFWIANRKLKTAQVLGPYFQCWEQVQGAAASGIIMSDGNKADCIGRSFSLSSFKKRAKAAGWKVLKGK